MLCLLSLSFLFFFNDTATTEIYTLSLHDALPIFESGPGVKEERVVLHRVEIEVLLEAGDQHPIERESQQDRKRPQRKDVDDVAPDAARTSLGHQFTSAR